MIKAVRWTPEMMAAYERRKVARAEPEKKPQKYRNTKTEVDGITFDSKKEAARWQELKLQEACGYIKDLRRQVPFELAPAVKLDGRMKPALRYWADFCYLDEGLLVVEDSKSPVTRKDPLYRAKRHLMATVHKIIIKET